MKSVKLVSAVLALVGITFIVVSCSSPFDAPDNASGDQTGSGRQHRGDRFGSGSHFGSGAVKQLQASGTGESAGQPPEGQPPEGNPPDGAPTRDNKGADNAAPTDSN